MQINLNVSTDGKGLWSSKKRSVALLDLDLAYVADDKKHGELRVYFDTRDWDVHHDGLIYTDRGFLLDLRGQLVVKVGFNILAVADINYSEQGMQEVDYISFDVGETFIKDWERVSDAKRVKTG